MALTGPERTIWPALLWLAAATSESERSAASNPITFSRESMAAIMAPANACPASCIAPPRSATNRCIESGVIRPAQAKAGSSPRLCPQAAQPFTPNRSSKWAEPKPIAASADWQARVSPDRISALPARNGSTMRSRAGRAGKRAENAVAAASHDSAISGNTHANSRNMPVFCEPCPGNNRTGFRGPAPVPARAGPTTERPERAAARASRHAA